MWGQQEREGHLSLQVQRGARGNESSRFWRSHRSGGRVPAGIVGAEIFFPSGATEPDCGASGEPGLGWCCWQWGAIECAGVREGCGEKKDFSLGVLIIKHVLF